MMTNAENDVKVFDEDLANEPHEHRLIPLEYGHPVTVTDADIPAGLTTENVAVVEMRGRRFRSLIGNDFPRSDWVDAFTAVKERYGDCFDFVVFFTDPRLPRIPYSGYHRGIYNEVQGINRGGFNARPTWNSDRLQSQIWMGRFSLGTLLQEIGHRWGAFARYRLTAGSPIQNNLMLPGGAHWARQFDDGTSPMDYDEEVHRPLGGNMWLREPVGGFEFKYCNLDLYLMGLKEPREVGRFTLIQNYTEVGPPLPGGRRLVQGNPLNLTVTNITRAEGRRVPREQDSQKQFRAAFVVVTRDEDRLDEAFVKKVEVLRQQAERYFQVATDNRACLNAELCCGHTISRSGTIRMRLRADKITWSPYLYHGLGPVPAKVEVGIETSIGGDPIDAWSREESPDITTGVQQLSAQVNRDPYDGRFRIVAQAKGSDLDIVFRWWASTIG
ncbi:MAG TPA: hypothetical protein EYH05_09720 [Anaerolineae bacterium]|nr:hypothetical protein [Anaerolineae bacterium]